MISEVKRVQLTCPKCKYEFSFNLGDLDSEILELGRDIQIMTKQLAEFKLLPIEQQNEKLSWRRKVIYGIEKKKEQLRKLKIKSKAVHDEVTRMNYHILKNVIKDFYGNDEFERCINEVIERGKAYKLNETIGIDNYTHAKGTIISKI